MSGSRLQRSLTVHPGKTFNAAAFAFGTFALSSTPSLFPSIVLTTVLLLQARAFLRRSFAGLHIAFLLLNLSLATTLANYSASTTALSTVGSSLGFSFLRSLATSIAALIPILISTSLNPQFKSSWLRLTFFPAVWTLTWSVICRVSPTGRLGSWTPLYGIEGYRWILPFTGLSGIDFITAFWAVVASESIGNWVQGSRPTDDEVWGDVDDYDRVTNGSPQHAIAAEETGDRHTDEPVGETSNSNAHGVAEVHRRSHAEKSTKSLVSAVLLLISLTIPSFYLFNLPLPPYSQNTESRVIWPKRKGYHR
ncbi:hypothetical protein FRC02_006999 [Tulasnella sp. 418]|nr:hypothetical protein FRC02_006999 [Tulasnella sp. 418]